MWWNKIVWNQTQEDNLASVYADYLKASSAQADVLYTHLGKRGVHVNIEEFLKSKNGVAVLRKIRKEKHSLKGGRKRGDANAVPPAGNLELVEEN